jgi:hypothetical protein
MAVPIGVGMHGQKLDEYFTSHSDCGDAQVDENWNGSLYNPQKEAELCRLTRNTRQLAG